MAMSRLDLRLRELSPSFTTARARAAGLSSRDVSALRDSGLIQELSRGVFRKADAPETAHLDLIAVSLRAHDAIVCLESALALHELIDDIPAAVHLAVPRGTWPPKIDYPPTTVSRFEPETFELGAELLEVSPGEMVRVYGAARSVVDAMRLSRWVGETTALHALGVYVRGERRHGLNNLINLARQFNVERPIRSAVEAVLA